MLVGQALIEKVNEMREDAANTPTAIAKSCGYLKDNGKADYVSFYTQLMDAKGLLPSQQESDEEISELHEELNEEYGEDAVDAFIEIWGKEDLEYFRDAYQGAYRDGATFAQEVLEDIYGFDLPIFIVIDWEATWDQLAYDYVEENGFIFSRNW